MATRGTSVSVLCFFSNEIQQSYAGGRVFILHFFIEAGWLISQPSLLLCAVSTKGPTEAGFHPLVVRQRFLGRRPLAAHDLHVRRFLEGELPKSTSTTNTA